MRFAYQFSLSDPTVLDYVMWQSRPLQPWYYVFADGSAGRRRTRLKQGPRHVCCSMPHVHYRGPRPESEQSHRYFLDFAVHATARQRDAGLSQALILVDDKRIQFTEEGKDIITMHTLPQCSVTTFPPSDASL